MSFAKELRNKARDTAVAQLRKKMRAQANFEMVAEKVRIACLEACERGEVGVDVDDIFSFASGVEEQGIWAMRLEQDLGLDLSRVKLGEGSTITRWVAFWNEKEGT